MLISTDIGVQTTMQILEAILDQAGRLMGSEGAAIYLRDDTGDDSLLRVQAARAAVELRGDAVLGLGHRPSHRGRRLGHGVASQVDQGHRREYRRGSRARPFRATVGHGFAA